LIAAAKLEAWGRKFQAPQYSIEIFTSTLLYSANADRGWIERRRHARFFQRGETPLATDPIGVKTYAIHKLAR
jgi:hypothetical protein